MTIISVIHIKHGIVKDISNFNYTEKESVLNTFTFHVTASVMEILKGDGYHSKKVIDDFCQDVYNNSNGLPCIAWGEDNSIQTIMEI